MFLFALGLRVYWLANKQGVSGNEATTVMICTGHDRNFEGGLVQLGREYTGAQLRDIVLCPTNSLGDDLNHLRTRNEDIQHTSLHMSLVRLALQGMRRFDFREYVWRVGAVQLLAFCVSFWLLFGLLRDLFGSRWTSVVISLVSGSCCLGVLSTTVYFRDYGVQEAALVALTWVVMRLWRSLLAGEDNALGLRRWLALTGTVAVAMYASFSSTIYIGIALAVAAALAWWRGQRPLIWRMAAAVVVAVALILPVYPLFYKGFMGGQGLSAMARLAHSNPLTHGLESAKALCWFVVHHLFYLPILALMCAVMWRCRPWRRLRHLTASDRAALLTVLVAFVWCALTIYMAAYLNLRFIAPAFPMVAVAVPLTLRAVRGPMARRCLLVITAATYAVLALVPAQRTYYHSEVEDVGLRDLRLSSIEHTYPGWTQSMPEGDPYVILLPNDDACMWSLSHIFPHLPDGGRFVFAHAGSAAEDYGDYSPGTVVVVSIMLPYPEIGQDLLDAGFEQLPPYLGNHYNYLYRKPPVRHLPAVCVQVDEGDMRRVDTNKRHAARALVTVMSENGDTLCHDVGKIRGRGQVSWESDKHSYNIKFARPLALMGDGHAASKWCVMGLPGDFSKVHSPLGLMLARHVGIPYTSTTNYVTLYVNGRYSGLYYVATKQDYTTAPAGQVRDVFELSMPKRRHQFVSRCGTAVRVRHGNERRVEKAVDAMERALLTDSVPFARLSKVMDVEGFARKCFVEMVTANSDVPLSQYFVTDRRGRIAPACAWDYDLTFGAPDVTPNRMPFNKWYYRLMQYPEFRDMLADLLCQHAPYIQDTLPAVVRAMADDISPEWQRDSARWASSPTCAVSDGYVSVLTRGEPLTSFRQHVEHIANFIPQRVDFLRSYWAEPDSFVCLEFYNHYMRHWGGRGMLTYYRHGDTLTAATLPIGVADAPRPGFDGWFTADGVDARQVGVARADMLFLHRPMAREKWLTYGLLCRVAVWMAALLLLAAAVWLLCRGK